MLSGLGIILYLAFEVILGFLELYFTKNIGNNIGNNISL
jgi:hypothetical protein